MSGHDVLAAIKARADTARAEAEAAMADFDSARARQAAEDSGVGQLGDWLGHVRRQEGLFAPLKDDPIVVEAVGAALRGEPRPEVPAEPEPSPYWQKRLREGVERGDQDVHLRVRLGQARDLQAGIDRATQSAREVESRLAGHTLATHTREQLTRQQYKAAGHRLSDDAAQAVLERLGEHVAPSRVA